MTRRLFAVGIAIAGLIANTAALAADQAKTEIFITNDRNEQVRMRFEYAFRNYTWKLIEAPIDAGDNVTYRFPANIPGCEYLREWHITDGVLSITNARGLFCTKRISLCDRVAMSMNVEASSCIWNERH